MKFSFIIQIHHFLLLSSLVFLLSSYITIRHVVSPAEQVSRDFTKELRLLDSCLSDLSTRAAGLGGDTSRIRAFRLAFLRSREQFKRLEFIADYFAPYLNINRPFLEEINERDDEAEPPQGFSVIENILYTRDLGQSTDLLAKELHLLKVNVQALQTVEARLAAATGSQLFEAMRSEIVRITTLGLTGYDTPESLTCLSESAVALEGIHKALRVYYPELKDDMKKKADKQFREAVSCLRENDDFNRFDRLAFIVNHLNPLSVLLQQVQKALNITLLSSTRFTAVDLTAPHIFDKTTFGKYYQVKGVADSSATVALGKLLFFDPILSGNNKRSCASCHNPERNFSDGLARSVAFDFGGTLERNAPAILNVSLQGMFFHDGRARTLEEQAAEVIENRREMAGNLHTISGWLGKSAEYRKHFLKAFGPSDTLISPYRITKAIAAFEKSLVFMNSPFDRYMAGDKKQLTPAQIRGFNLFMGKAQCATCHFPPLFSGLLPPDYKKMETEVIGTLADNNFASPTLAADIGRYAVTHVALQKHGFKTPSVRNASLTAPYMHNGAFNTLREVITFYNLGRAQGMGIDLSNQTLPPDTLGLSEKEIDDLIAFIGSLNDQYSLRKPSYLPPIAGCGKRVAGGEY